MKTQLLQQASLQDIDKQNELAESIWDVIINPPMPIAKCAFKFLYIQ